MVINSVINCVETGLNVINAVLNCTESGQDGNKSAPTEHSFSRHLFQIASMGYTNAFVNSWALGWSTDM